MNDGEVFAAEAFLTVIVVVAGFDRAFIFDAREGTALVMACAGFSKIYFALLHEAVSFIRFCIFCQGDAELDIVFDFLDCIFLYDYGC